MRKRDVVFAGLAILALWQILAMIVDRSILPSPVVVIPVFFEELLRGDMLKHAAISFWRVLAGMLLAVLLAAPAGLVLGQSKKLNRFFSPVIYLLYPIPKVVLVPIVLLFFGVGNFPKIFIIFMILFFQILVLVRDQALALPRGLIQSVRSLGLVGVRFFILFIFRLLCPPF